MILQTLEQLFVEDIRLLCNVRSSFNKSVDETQECDYSNESF